MSLLKHRGLSGAAVEIKDNKVLKWTKGKDASPVLKQSLMWQKGCTDELLPIKPAEVCSYSYSENSVQFEMPIYPETAFTNLSYKVESQIEESIRSRLSYACERPDFAVATLQQAIKCPDSTLKNEFLKSHDLEPRFYPAGYAHGDFGFANMMVEDDQIYMIDFTPFPIWTPLIDIATLELSLFSESATKKHVDLAARIRKEHQKWVPQINILRKLKVLSYQNADKYKDRYDGFF